MAKSEEKFVNVKHQARSERERRQNRIIIIAAIAVAIIVIGLVGFAFVNEYLLKPNQSVATVGSEKISLQDFQSRVRYDRFNLINQKDQYLNFKSSPYIDESTAQYIDSIIAQIQTQLDTPTILGQKTLDQMIDEAIITIEAKKRGITVSEAEIDTVLQESFGFFPNGTPTPTITPTMIVAPTLSTEQLAQLRPTATQAPTATPDTSIPTATAVPTLEPTAGPTPTLEPTAAPEPTATPITQEGYRSLLDEQLTTYKIFGFDEKDLREVARVYLLRQKVSEAITADISADQDQILALHILLATEEEAKAAYERVVTNGEDWYDVAAEVSTDTSNKDNGGYLGWFAKEAMDADFSTAAFQLNVGDISQPVKTQFGYHIIKVIGRETLPVTASQLTTIKDNAFTEWLAKAKTEITVTPNDTLWQANVPSDPIDPNQ